MAPFPDEIASVAAGGRAKVEEFLESLPASSEGTLIGLFVDERLGCLAGQAVELGDSFDLLKLWPALLRKGTEEGAAGVVLALVPRPAWLEPSAKLVRDVAHIREVSADFEMPLLDFFIRDRFGLQSIGGLGATLPGTRRGEHLR